MASSLPSSNLARYEWDSNESTKNIPSYNEVMLNHRNVNVKEWTTAAPATSYDIKRAVRNLKVILKKLDEIDVLLDSYSYSEVLSRLNSPMFQLTLSRSFEVIRSSGILSFELSNDIGFSWGSCAWRHCGSRADAEEAIGEMNKFLGMFEPFEGHFTVGIVRRCIEEVLEATPKEYF
ncbi:hypothetical protein TrST_g3858 [Triparma strigata]|uniref:Uncharacterized protein n=1 Tax=Triparma strigata TaxID=1606541 RepID=A0A9W6ZLW4_9STRA|nr:hypothetical protein TrST_g3858 [Triparma strigata]